MSVSAAAAAELLGSNDACWKLETTVPCSCSDSTYAAAAVRSADAAEADAEAGDGGELLLVPMLAPRVLADFCVAAAAAAATTTAAAAAAELVVVVAVVVALVALVLLAAGLRVATAEEAEDSMSRRR